MQYSKVIPGLTGAYCARGKDQPVKAFTYAAAGIALAVTVLGCGSTSGGSSAASTAGSSASAGMGAIAAGADPYLTEAVTLIQPCLAATHLATAKSCIEGKVPPTKRDALKKCLADDVAGSVGTHGATAKFRSGAQACTATALR